ncbi:MAG: hypothetical protein ABI651_04640 [Verrucomicrobiota bacterium]
MVTPGTSTVIVGVRDRVALGDFRERPVTVIPIKDVCAAVIGNKKIEKAVVV